MSRKLRAPLYSMTRAATLDGSLIVIGGFVCCGTESEHVVGYTDKNSSKDMQARHSAPVPSRPSAPAAYESAGHARSRQRHNDLPRQ